MPKSGTLTKAHIIDAVAEANGYTRNKSFEIIEILARIRIKATLESGEDVIDFRIWTVLREGKKINAVAGIQPPEKT